MSEKLAVADENVSRNECHLEQEAATESPWMKFDAIAELKAVLKSFNEEESISSTLDWFPRNTVNFANSYPKTSDVQLKGKAGPSEPIKIVVPNVAPIDDFEVLKQRYEQISNRTLEIHNLMENLIGDVMKYVELLPQERELFDYEKFVNNNEFLKQRVRHFKCAIAILNYDLRSASEVTVEKVYMEETVANLDASLAEIGIMYEKYQYVVIMMEVEREECATVKKVSSDLRQLQSAVLQMEGFIGTVPDSSDSSNE